jgi:hypothetical protein
MPGQKWPGITLWRINMAERKKRSVVMPEIKKPDLNAKEECPLMKSEKKW